MNTLTPHDTKCLQEFKQYMKGNLYLHVNSGKIIKIFIVQNVKVSFIRVRLKKSNEMQQYADIYLLLNYSTCFGRSSRPSSGVYKNFLAPQIV